MAKVWIDEDEDWPVYRLTPEGEEDSGMYEVELSDELLARLPALTEEWYRVQDEIATVVRAMRKR